MYRYRHSLPIQGGRRYGGYADVAGSGQDATNSAGVGGAASASGESFRDDLATRIAICILAQAPLWEHSTVDVVPRRISCETAEHIDDIAVHTSRGRLLVQAKGDAKLALPDDATARKNPLADPFVKAIAQLVAQQTSPRPPSTPLIPSTDRFVLAYKDATKELARLRDIAARLSTEDKAGEEFDVRPRVLHGADDEVFESFRKVVTAITGASWGWTELVALLRVTVFWWVAPEGAGRRIPVDPYNLLRWVLADPDATSKAANIISRKMLELAASRASMDADALRSLLTNEKFELQALPDYSGDLDRVEEASTRYLASIERRTCLAPIARKVTSRLLIALEDGATVLVGDRGMGKSTVLASVARELRKRKRQVVVCDLRQAAANIFPGLRASMERVLAAIGDPLPAYLLIDGLDETSHNSELAKAVLSLCDVSAEDRRWRLLATARTRAMGSPEWRRRFKGSPVESSPDEFLQNLHYARVDRFDPEELDHALGTISADAASIIRSSERLRRFVETPENFALLSDLVAGTAGALGEATYASGLVSEYWARRVSYKDAIARRHALLEIDRLQQEAGASTSMFADVVGRGVTVQILAELEDDRVITIVDDRVSITHELVVDYIRAGARG